MLPPEEVQRLERLDRHALVMAVWLPMSLLAGALLHYGLGPGGPVWVLAAFGPVLAGFGGHVIVNAALGTEFSPREVALGLLLYLCAVVALAVAALAVDGFVRRHFLPGAVGLAALAAAVIFYMVTRFGVRRAFENFDVIREFGLRRPGVPRRRRC